MAPKQGKNSVHCKQSQKIKVDEKEIILNHICSKENYSKLRLIIILHNLEENLLAQ